MSESKIDSRDTLTDIIVNTNNEVHAFIKKKKNKKTKEINQETVRFHSGGRESNITSSYGISSRTIDARILVERQIAIMETKFPDIVYDKNNPSYPLYIQLTAERDELSYQITAAIKTRDSMPRFLSRAVTLASECSCRSVLEKLAKSFLDEHHHAKLCQHQFSFNESTSSILRHYDECEGVTREENNRLGDKISSQLNRLGVQQASQGTYLTTFKNLCDNIHNSELLKTDDDKVIVPSSMSNIDKRFMIRYLIGKGYDLESVLICGYDGSLRAPREEELTTPPKKRKASSENDK